MGRQGKGISISTMQKGAILRKCVNTFVPHCRFLVARLCCIENAVLCKNSQIKTKISPNKCSKTSFIIPLLCHFTIEGQENVQNTRP